MGEVTCPTLAVIELLDRDGAVRHSTAVRAWPLRVGRALDNHLVLDDPHTAAHHFSIEPDADGHIALTAGDSLNGVLFDAHRLATGERAVVGDKPPLLTVGRTHLRLRLASHALAPEQALRAARSLTQRLPTLALLAMAAMLALATNTYLDTNPDNLTRAFGLLAIYAASVLFGWAGVWTLLSKLFTHSGHFGWHVRVLLIAVLAWQAVTLGSALLAFSLSWPFVADFSFVPGYLIVGAMLYFHLQAVEPNHPQRTLGFAAASAATGIVLSLWSNWQGGDRLGSELYMHHLFPPALRVAKPVDTPHFMQGVSALQAELDKKAKQDVAD